MLSFNGTRLKLTVARSPAEYLRAVDSPVMPTSQILWVRQSKRFDLVYRDQRAYVRNEAEIGLPQKAA